MIATDGDSIPTPLFLSDEQLWALVSPQLTRAAFLRNLLELETRGFPRFDPIFKGRYWPAVRAWLDRRAGIGNREIVAVDGEETWEPLKKIASYGPRKPRPSKV